MKKLTLPLILAFAVALLTSAKPLGDSGKTLFEKNKCNKCHAIESQGITCDGKAPSGKQPPDLSDVGSKHKADWIERWLMKEEEQNGKKHMKKFGGSEDELKTVATWLASLKKK